MVTLAPDPTRPARLYHIIWTYRGEEDEVTRIITARRAEPNGTTFL